MSSMPNQIELLVEIANRLCDPPETLREKYLKHGPDCLAGYIKKVCLRDFDIVRDWFRYYKPRMVKSLNWIEYGLRSEVTNILDDASKGKLSHTDRATTAEIDFNHIVENIMRPAGERLRYIAEMARQDFQHEAVLTKEERRLLVQIATNIKMHPDTYREAGKWLDKYYSMENFWQQREDELRTLKMLHRPQTADDAEKYKIEYLELMMQLKVYIPIGSFEFWSLTREEPAAQTLQPKPETSEKIKSLLAVLDLSKEEQERWVFENLPEYRDGDLSLSAFAFSLWKPFRDQIRMMKPPPIRKVRKSLERWRRIEKEPPICYRFRDGQNALLWKCRSKDFLTTEEAKRIFLLTWLITDPGVKEAHLGITEFENWDWNQGLRGRDFLYYETLIECTKSRERWMKLVLTAWAKLEAEKDLESEKPAKTEQDTTRAKEEKAAINVHISGDVQAENLQIGDYASIHKQAKTEKKNKGTVKRLLKIIGAVIGFLAALLGIFHYLGWLEPIKAFIEKTLGPE